MIRSLGFVAIIFVSALFLPFWVQGILYIWAILTIQHKSLVLLPAIFSDVWYAPSENFNLGNLRTTLLVLVGLVVYFLIIKNTRLLQNNGLAKK